MASTLLDEALEGWRFAREGVIAEFENIPPDAFDFKPAPASRSLAELARHIIESGAMMAGELSRPDGNFRRRPAAELMGEYALSSVPDKGKTGWIALLRRSHQDGDRQIRDAGELWMLQRIIQFNGEPASRLSWMSHGVAHEEYHRGQVALYARLLGQIPALTRLIHGS